MSEIRAWHHEVSHFVPQAQLFLLVLQGEEEGGAAVPQGLHLTGAVLEGLALPHKGLQVLLRRNVWLLEDITIPSRLL
jgi:hypothetical protein